MFYIELMGMEIEFRSRFSRKKIKIDVVISSIRGIVGCFIG